MSRYLAFISYRHKDRDRRIAGLLRRGLENWHLPKNAPFDRKGRRVFRDTDELPTSANLGADIENALEESQWLIALCSESYVESKWCRRELEIFIGLGRKDHILPVLIGEKAEDCIPDLIRDLPVAVKIEQKDRSADRAIAALLARMAEEPSEAYVRYFRAEKSRRALRYSAIACAAVAAIAGLTVYANLSAARIAQNNERIVVATQETVKAEQEAKEERNRAMLMNARMLSTEAWAAIDEGDTDRAVDLSLSALPENLHGDEPVSDEAVSALRAALSSPNKPVDEWIYSNSYYTDFDIKGYVSNNNLYSVLMLLDGRDSVEEHLLYYSTGEIAPAKGKSRVNAAALGYSKGYLTEYSTQRDIYYGSENKLISTASGGEDGYLLGGDYIYADHLYESNFYVVTWLEHPEEGKESPVCLIYLRDQDAIGALDVAGFPISLSASPNTKRIAIVDEAGVLSFFSTKNGEKVATLPGKWKSVYYPNFDSKFVCIDEEGRCYLYDAISMTKTGEFDSPTAIKSIQYCSQKGIFLTICADAVRIYDKEGKNLICTCPFHQDGVVPQFAVFENYNEYVWTHDGNTFYLIYDRRVDQYVLDTQMDLSQTDYIPLYEEGLYSRCAKAFYSQDSKYVYRQEYDGEITKWDATTGEFLWVNQDALLSEFAAYESAIESADGEFLWRPNGQGNGIEKIDAQTGETVYDVSWSGRAGRISRLCMPVETSGNLAVCSIKFQPKLIGFAKDTGEFRWVVEEGGLVFGFSEDEKWIYAFDKNETEKEVQLVRRVISCQDGTVAQEEVLFCIPKEYAKDFLLNYDRRSRVLSLSTDVTKWKTPDGSEGEITKYVSIYDAATGQELNHWEMDRDGYFVFSYTGKMGYYWTNPEDQDDYCVELLPNGAKSEIISVATPEGRKLTTTYFDEIDTNRFFDHGDRELAYGRFCGDDVVMDQVELSPTVRITRISDGVTLLDLPGKDVSRGVALAPDGSGACIYGYWTNPRIILASDVDALVEKARKKQGGRTK